MSKWEELPEEAYVYCPRCGSLVGFKVDDKTPKIEKVRFQVGKKKYPVVSVDKVGKLPFTCPFCGYEFPEVK